MDKKYENKLQSILDELENVKTEMTALIEIAPDSEKGSRHIDDALESLDDVIGKVADNLDEVR